MRLLLDEMWTPTIALELRKRAFDVVAITEPTQAGRYAGIADGVTYSRFETVPDAPITSFETNLPQGPHSVLAATGNLCAGKLSIPTELTGQNGALVKQSTPVTVTGCPKAKVLTLAQKLAIALKACKKKAKGKKRTSCGRAARRKYGPAKKAKKATKKK